MFEVYINLDRILWQKLIESYKKQNKECIKLMTGDPDFSLDILKQTLFTQNLFGESRIIFLSFSSEKEEKKVINEEFISMLSQDMPHELIINLYKKPLAKSKMMELIKKHATLKDVPKETTQSFNRLVSDIFKERNINLESSALQRFLEIMQLDKARFYQEADKLALLSRLITLQDIEVLVNEDFEDDIFAFSNALINKELVTMMRLYNQFLDKQVEPLALMGLIASSLRTNFQIKQLHEKHYDNESIASFTHVSEKQIYYILRNQNKPSKQILDLLVRLKDTEQGIKLGKLNKQLMFELFLVEIMQ